MARINRSDVIQKAVNDLALSASDSIIPSETLDKVQCVYSLNKQFSSFCASANSTSTGTTTITLPTIDARSEIYITGIDCGIVKDATCDVASGQVALVVTTFEQGITKNVMAIPVLTLTAQDQHATLTLAYPLKIKPNTNATFNMSFTVGTSSRSACITGYIVSSH